MGWSGLAGQSTDRPSARNGSLPCITAFLSFSVLAYDQTIPRPSS